MDYRTDGLLSPRVLTSHSPICVTAARGDNHHANLQAELHAKQNHEKVCAKLTKLTKLEVLK
jgi:hypothetical protein